MPLLVQAQRRVADRIASVSGSPVPQPHYMELQQRLGHLVSARDYLTAQLRVHFDPARTKLIKPGAQIDPLGHDAYTGTGECLQFSHHIYSKYQMYVKCMFKWPEKYFRVTVVYE